MVIAGVAVVAAAFFANTPQAALGGGQARAFSGQPTVGALFIGSNTDHTCTASVVHSAGHDTIVTAAHCLTGNGKGVTFAPGYRGGDEPFGRWNVTAAYVTSAKFKGRANGDVAVLKVAPRQVANTTRNIEDVTGALWPIDGSPVAGLHVTVVGYNEGSGDIPVRCVARTGYAGASPVFSCDGFSGGTSGSPWMKSWAHKTYITGIIGGRHNGGCLPEISFSPRFGDQLVQLLARADRGEHGDVVPAADSDDC